MHEDSVEPTVAQLWIILNRGRQDINLLGGGHVR